MKFGFLCNAVEWVWVGIFLQDVFTLLFLCCCYFPSRMYFWRCISTSDCVFFNEFVLEEWKDVFPEAVCSFGCLTGVPVLPWQGDCGQRLITPRTLKAEFADSVSSFSAGRFCFSDRELHAISSFPIHFLGWNFLFCVFKSNRATLSVYWYSSDPGRGVFIIVFDFLLAIFLLRLNLFSDCQASSRTLQLFGNLCPVCKVSFWLLCFLVWLV